MSTQTTPAPVTTTRDPLDPAEKLWRLSKSERREILEPFIGKWVSVERWYTRVSSGGDQIYRGTLVAVAISTLGSAADLAIIQTIDGTTWAISIAQIAHLSLVKAAQ